MTDFGYLKYIRVFNAPEDPEECFQGLGASAAGVEIQSGESGTINVTVDGVSGVAAQNEIDGALWSAQNAVITAQTNQFKEVKSELATKWEDLPAKLKAKNVKESLVEEFLKFLADKAATYFWGKVAGEVAELVVSLGAAAIRFLDALYTEGEAMCDALIKENEKLLTLSASREHYALRADVVLQHAHMVHALLSEVEETEKQVSSQSELVTAVQHIREEFEKLNETMELIQVEDNIVQCPHSGDTACEIYSKSLAMDVTELS